MADAFDLLTAVYLMPPVKPSIEKLPDTLRSGIIDKYLNGEITNYANLLFTRCSAKNTKFNAVDFKYSYFENCYLRGCVFSNCDFTGCRFIGCNFHGASFEGCKFDYATFQNTLITPDILKTNCPPGENLKLKFARSLRVNFQGIGEVEAANDAIAVELEATECHLRNAWRSNDRYYRLKYKGWSRVVFFFRWLKYYLLKLIWGNGESAFRLVLTTLVFLILMTVIDLRIATEPRACRHWLP